MSQSDLELLPPRIAAHSISPREIVLPLQEAIETVSLLESMGILILGWEGWVKCSDGRVGHGNAPQGTVSLERLSVQEAAELCRKTMLQDAEQWKTENPNTSDELYFCITPK